MLQSGKIIEEVPIMAQYQDVSRRDFVKAAGAVTAVAAAIPAVHGAPGVLKARAANDQVQFGIIGTGSRGSYLLKHLKGIDNGRCVAACDINADNLKHGVDTIGNNPKQFKDYRELLASKDVDAVIVTTPLFVHFPVTRDALMAGKHVFCEKCLVSSRKKFTPCAPCTWSVPSRRCRPDCSAGTATSTRP